MTTNDNDRASRPDDANPEWTRDEVRDARPALEVFKELFGPEAAEMVKRGRGRPAKGDKKVNQTLRLDVDVLDAYRQNGRGWQALMNRVLRAHMPGVGK
ncbi:MAG: BrnA antitoxin family protein [Rhodopila sp.]|nr:BrnA antitoxin family protein [Rhodopila sp.]